MGMLLRRHYVVKTEPTEPQKPLQKEAEKVGRTKKTKNKTSDKK